MIYPWRNINWSLDNWSADDECEACGLQGERKGSKYRCRFAEVGYTMLRCHHAALKSHKSDML